MRNTLLVIIFALGLTGCGRIDRAVAGITGNGTETCYKGVVYLQFTSGAVQPTDRQGNPLPCGD